MKAPYDIIPPELEEEAESPYTIDEYIDSCQNAFLILTDVFRQMNHFMSGQMNGERFGAVHPNEILCNVYAMLAPLYEEMKKMSGVKE